MEQGEGSIAEVELQTEAPHARLAQQDVANARRVPAAAGVHGIGLIGQVGDEERRIDRRAANLVPVDVEVQQGAARQDAATERAIIQRP